MGSYYGRHRQVGAVLLRLLEDGSGKALYTFAEMSTLLDYTNRRNTHNFWQEFTRAVSDFQVFRERQRTGGAHAYIEEL